MRVAILLLALLPLPALAAVSGSSLSQWRAAVPAAVGGRLARRPSSSSETLDEGGQDARSPIARAADDLMPLSDEFNDSSTLLQWKRVYVVEGWGANQLEVQDINTTRAGRMVMIPFTSTWFNDYR